MPDCRLYAGGGTDLGLKRDRNDDRFAIVADLGLLVVADGMGGRPAGDVAAGIAVDTLCEALAHPDLETTWPEEGADPRGEMGRRLCDAIALANGRIREQAQAHVHLTRMATTIVVAVMVEGTLWTAHVGDSRAYLVRGGQIRRLTSDHSIAEDAVERARHTPEELRQMSLWILTRGLGLSDSIQADVHSHELRAGDVIILATDGLTSLLTAGEMLDVLDEHQDIGAAVSTLIDLSNARGGHDNITVLIGRWAP